ncbi:hypothetical protein Tco_0832100 [Tanacetum coccineum]
MEEHRASMEAYKKVHNETVRSELRMAIVQQSIEMDMWEIKEKRVERREQMAIRAYEEDKRHEEWYQKIEEDKRREEWYQKIEDDKRRQAWNQKIEEMINLIDYFIQNPISSVKTPQPVTTKVPAVTTTVPAKPIQNSACYDDLTSDQNKKITEKGVEREKRKGPFVWTKSKSRVVIKVGQTEAIEGGLNCDNRSANYGQPCQHLLMFDYDPQEGELQVKTWDHRITWLKILKEHLEDKVAKNETEKMLIQMVEAELEIKKKDGKYKKEFKGNPHFFG